MFTRKPHTNNRHSSFFYQLLHTAGAFPPGAPATVRMISTKFAGPLTPEQMIDRYDLACQPVRDLLVDYLRERQPGIDYSTLNQLAGHPRAAALERPGEPPSRHQLPAPAARRRRRLEAAAPGQDRPHARRRRAASSPGNQPTTS